MFKALFFDFFNLFASSIMPRQKAGAKGSEFPTIPKVADGKTRAAWTQAHKNAISSCVIQNPKLTAKACWEQLGWNAAAGKNTVDFSKFESQFKLIKAKEVKKIKDGDATRNKGISLIILYEVLTCITNEKNN